MLSSTWRLSETTQQRVNEALAEVGLAACIGATPVLPLGSRPMEIWRWLRDTLVDAGEGVRFLARDDIPLEALDKTPGRCLQGRCVLTQKRTGLTRELAGQGLRLLAQQALWRA